MDEREMLPITCNSEIESDACPIRNVLSNVMGKWRIIIILSLEDGALRFAEVKRTVGDITQRVLTENLRGLERDGYLTRSVSAGPPLAVTYDLTERGRAFAGQIRPLVFWARDNMEDVKRSRTEFEAENAR